MAAVLKKYSKAELLQILDEKCPDVLAKFPPPEAFEFRTYDRNGKEHVAVKVGFKVTKQTREVKDELWLEEYRIIDPESLPRLPPAHQRFQIGNAGPMAGFDPIFRPAYGAEAKDEYKRHKKYMGLYYTIRDDIGMNNAVYNVGCIKGNETFGKFNESEFIGPWSNMVKAMLRFVFLHCGFATDYEEFEDANGKIQGLGPLMRALRAVARRTPSEEQSVEQSASTSEHESSDNEDEVFVPNGGHSNKRLHDGDDETSAVEKKARKA